MTNWLKEREERFIRKVDTTQLFIIEQSAARIRKEAEQIENKLILDELAEMARAIAAAWGRVETIELEKHRMPSGGESGAGIESLIEFSKASAKRF